MSRDAIEDRIQDYLDGRLSDAERAEFEARVSREPELARRLEDYRRIGQALREDDAALSPGFYTRARARFEAAAGAPARGFRWISWEAAGLSAAVLLAAAIFLPGLLRQEESAPELPRRAKTAEGAITRDERAPQAGAPAVEPDEPAEPFVPVPPAAPRESEIETADEAEAGLAEAEPFAPVPPAAPLEPESEAEKKDSSEPRLREQAAPRAERADRLGFARSVPPPVAETVVLAPGTLEPGTIRLATAEEARRQLAVPENEWLQKRVAAKPSVDTFADESKRFVLIGSRPGLLECSALSVEVSEVAYLIRLLPMDREGGSAGPDCAVILPLDDREIVVLESSEDG